MKAGYSSLRLRSRFPQPKGTGAFLDMGPKWRVTRTLLDLIRLLVSASLDTSLVPGPSGMISLVPGKQQKILIDPNLA